TESRDIDLNAMSKGKCSTAHPPTIGRGKSMGRLAQLFRLANEFAVVLGDLVGRLVVRPLAGLELDAVAQPSRERPGLAPFLENGAELVLERSRPILGFVEVLERAVPRRLDLT